MIDKSSYNVKIPDEIDSVLNRGIKKANRIKFLNKIKVTTSIVAAILCIMITIGITNPALAKEFSRFDKIYEMFSDRSSNLNISDVSNDIKVTVEDVICDGETLYVSYKIKNKEPFPYVSKDIDIYNSPIELSVEDIKYSFTNEELAVIDDEFHGEFKDKNTFLAVASYDLSILKEKVPDKFNVNIKINSIDNSRYNNDVIDNEIYNGDWNFNIPVKVDKTSMKTYDGFEDNGIKVDSISFTDICTKVVTSDCNLDFMNSEISIYDDKGNKIKPYRGYGSGNSGKTVSIFSPISKESKYIRVVVEEITYENNKEVERNEIAEKIIMLDK